MFDAKASPEPSNDERKRPIPYEHKNEFNKKGNYSLRELEEKNRDNKPMTSQNLDEKWKGIEQMKL